MRKFPFHEGGKVRDAVPGDILAWRGKGIGSWIIRTFTRSDFAHVGVVVRWEDGREEVLEADPRRGVISRPIQDTLPAYHVATHSTWRDDARRIAARSLGIKYSYLDGILAFFHLRTISPGYQCAELVREILLACYIRTPEVCTIPDDLVFYFLTSRGCSLRLLNPEA
jgi:hypothetical protein